MRSMTLRGKGRPSRINAKDGQKAGNRETRRIGEVVLKYEMSIFF